MKIALDSPAIANKKEERHRCSRKKKKNTGISGRGLHTHTRFHDETHTHTHTRTTEILMSRKTCAPPAGGFVTIRTWANRGVDIYAVANNCVSCGAVANISALSCLGVCVRARAHSGFIVAPHSWTWQTHDLYSDSIEFSECENGLAKFLQMLNK